MAELAAFDFDRIADPDRAWHDKIEWVFTPFFLPPACDPKEFLESIALAGHHPRRPQNCRNYGWLFGASAGVRQGYSRAIRKISVTACGVELETPLFSGNINLRNKESLRFIEFALQINPTRLIHHHPRSLGRRRESWLNADELSATRAAIRFDREFSLDASDNWVPQTESHRPAWRRPAESAKRCFQKIEAALRAECYRASETRCIEDSGHRHSIRYLETYWEFSHPDPVRLAWSLKPLLIQFSKKTVAINHYQTRRLGSQKIPKSCVSVIVPLGAGEFLAVYAKTNERIRFEVRQDFQRNTACLGGGYTAAGLGEVSELLAKARRHCARRINECFAYLGKQKECPKAVASPSMFLARVASALRSSDDLHTVLSILLTLGKLEQIAALAPSIRSLKNAGIIQWEGLPQRGNYQVTPRYANALAKLRRQGMGSLFETRER